MHGKEEKDEKDEQDYKDAKNLYDLYFPLVSQKLDVNYHHLEKWMTLGILISRKVRFAYAILA